MTPNEWTTSSACSGGDCIAVRYTLPGHVLVRDTKDRARTPAVFTPAAWAAFTAGVRAGEFGAVS